MGYDIPPRTPFVGRDFNVTKAGIHADGLMKDEEIYNIFNTEKLLNRPAQVIIDAHSGLAGIAHWLKHRCPDEQSAEIDKRSPIVLRMKEIIDKFYEDGRTTSMSDAELIEIYKTAKEQ
jgi:isopropylmalate/homocitrate/citramalate synthase